MLAETLPKVVVILINFNAYFDTCACIKSLQSASYPNLLIILVDNASTDDSCQKLSIEFPFIQIVKNAKNSGFAGGNNVGMHLAMEIGFDYILLLNNDTLVKSDFLEPAVSFAEANPKVGLIGGKIYFYNPPNQIWDAGGEIDWIKGHGRRLGNGADDKGQYNMVRKTTFVTGCMMLIRREVIEKIGYLPDEYFFGVEEWDYSVTAAKRGFQLAFVPEFVIWHKVGASHNHLDAKWVYNYIRSRLLFMRRHAPIWWYPIWLCAMQIYGFYKARFQFPSLSPKNSHELAHAVRLAFYDHQRKQRIDLEDLMQFK